MSRIIPPPIDYRLIADALDFYQGVGFQYIEVPWEVGIGAAISTCRDVDKILRTNRGTALVGSAEQGMLDLLRIDCVHSDTPYVAVSPCFRLKEPDTQYHFEQFMKVELGEYVPSDNNTPGTAKSSIIERAKQRAQEMLHYARSFYSAHTSKEVEIVQDLTDTYICHDLVIDGVEVGSYGVRLYGFGAWVYGTGIAEPRFSLVR